MSALLLAAIALTAACEEDPATTGATPAAVSTPRPTIAAEDVLATAAAFGEAWAAEAPTATPAPVPVVNPEAVTCAPPGGEPASDYAHFLHWTPDGSRLIFNLSDTIWMVDSQGTSLDAIVDAGPPGPEADNPSDFTFYADLSPDGSRIVYSTCEYPLVVSSAEGVATRYPRQIALAGLDGGGRQRLTESPAFDGYPAWSPDGKTIAFIRSGGFYDYTWIFLIEEGSVPSGWWIGEHNVEAVLSPPAWSPDGESLALVAYESTPGESRPCLYTGAARAPDVIQFRTTRSAVFRVTEATGPPSWSPDGRHIAFTRSGGEDAGVYVVRPNGSAPQRIVDGSGKGPLWPSDVTELPENVDTFRGSPAWSPDGERLLFATREIDPNPIGESTGFVPSRVFIVGLDGSNLSELVLPIPEFLRVTAAAWSPDGSRVAVSGDIRQFAEGEYAVRRVVLTADPDGENMRILAARDTDLELVN